MLETSTYTSTVGLASSGKGEIEIPGPKLQHVLPLIRHCTVVVVVVVAFDIVASLPRSLLIIYWITTCPPLFPPPLLLCILTYCFFDVFFLVGVKG